MQQTNPTKAQGVDARVEAGLSVAPGQNDVWQTRRTREPQESWRILDLMPQANPAPARDRPLFAMIDRSPTCSSSTPGNNIEVF
jgi:hypothetical protein